MPDCAAPPPDTNLTPHRQQLARNRNVANWPDNLARPIYPPSRGRSFTDTSPTLPPPLARVTLRPCEKCGLDRVRLHRMAEFSPRIKWMAQPPDRTVIRF